MTDQPMTLQQVAELLRELATWGGRVETRRCEYEEAAATVEAAALEEKPAEVLAGFIGLPACSINRGCVWGEAEDSACAARGACRSEKESWLTYARAEANKRQGGGA